MADETYTYLVLPLLTGGTAPPVIQRGSDSAFIPCNLANRDYQAFLAWLDEGNLPPEGWTGPTNDPPAA